MNRNIPIPPGAFEEIESYLLQQMTAEKQQAFEQKLAIDTVLQDQFKQVQLTLTAIKEISVTASLKHFYTELPASDSRVIKINSAAAVKRWLVAASTIILLACGSWLLFKKNSNEKLYARYFQPDPGLISAMSITDNYVFDKAMIDYKTGNYTTAIAAWKTLQKSDTSNDTLSYFIGAAYLANDESKNAIPYLQSVAKPGGGFFVTDACWYLGLVLLKEGNVQEAVFYIRQSTHPQKQALLQQLQQSP